MPFEVPASKKSIAQNRFEFTLDDRTYSIPLLKFATVEAAEALEEDRTVRAVMLACETEEAADAVRSLDGEQFNALVSAWAEASGITVPESLASTDS